MNDLAVIDRALEFHRLKALVLAAFGVRSLRLASRWFSELQPLSVSLLGLWAQQ